MREFIKGLRTLAQQEGWLIESSEDDEGVRQLVVFRKVDGELQRIATIIVKAEEDLIPEVAEGIIDSVKKRLEAELADSAATTLRQAVRSLLKWTIDFFS